MFDFPFTQKQIIVILSDNEQAPDWFYALNDNLPNFEITSLPRVAGFLAQTTHESNNYMSLHENLNYRAESLVRTWPKRFTRSIAQEYAHKPEMIANKVYANRMGNGTEESGDGWKYRGRGIIQITGKDNYTACSEFLFQDHRLLETPDLLETDMDMAIKSACWFWTANSLNQYCDEQDIKKLTQRINGGVIGLADRIHRFNDILALLQTPSLQETQNDIDTFIDP